MQEPEFRGPQLPPGQRLVAGVFGGVFAAIGVLTIGWLWLQPFGGFGAPPVSFRLFGSLIAVCFVAVGGTIFLGAVNNRLGPSPNPRLRGEAANGTEPSHNPLGTAYACPRCGAPLGDGADVSPHGDAKCGYCNAWFNIHQA